jgi:hypothetical protein
MRETPTLDIQEIRSVLTDAGHTAVGFAALAYKKAIDVRHDLTDRYEESFVDFRKQALVAVKRAESVRSDVEARIEPVVAKVVDRLPEPAQKLVNDATEAAKGFQGKSYDFVVKALTVDAPARKTATSVKSKATSVKTGTARATKTAATKTAAATRSAARKAGVKTASARKSVATKAAPAAKRVAKATAAN